LQITQQFRYALHFVDNERGAVLREKVTRAGFCELANARFFQIDVGVLRENSTRQSGFAGLTRPRQGDNAEFAGKLCR
jgi:hypothetical protein